MEYQTYQIHSCSYIKDKNNASLKSVVFQVKRDYDDSPDHPILQDSQIENFQEDVEMKDDAPVDSEQKIENNEDESKKEDDKEEEKQVEDKIEFNQESNEIVPETPQNQQTNEDPILDPTNQENIPQNKELVKIFCKEVNYKEELEFNSQQKRNIFKAIMVKWHEITQKSKLKKLLKFPVKRKVIKKIIDLTKIKK